MPRRSLLIRLIGLVAALAGLVAILGGLRATEAAFTAEETVAIEVTSATVAIAADGAGLQFSSAPLAPGDAATATVRVRNTGTIPAMLTLGRENLESTSPNACAVRDALQLKVVEDLDGDATTTADRATVADAPLATAAASADLGAVAVAAARTYEFTLTFAPQRGATAADNDNCFQGSVDRERFTWTSVEVPAP